MFPLLERCDLPLALELNLASSPLFYLHTRKLQERPPTRHGLNHPLLGSLFEAEDLGVMRKDSVTMGCQSMIGAHPFEFWGTHHVWLYLFFLFNLLQPTSRSRLPTLRIGSLSLPVAGNI